MGLDAGKPLASQENKKVGGEELRCLIAVEEKFAGIFKSNLSKMSKFSDWTFDVCTDSTALKEWAGKDIDVLVLSRNLPGSDPVRLLSQLRTIFQSAHIVLWVGEVTESNKVYMRAAAKAGLHNTVTGKPPGDRPYTLMVALTRSKQPELDGYVDLGDADENVSENTVLDDRGDDDREETDELTEDYPVAPVRPEMIRRHAGTDGIVVISTANKGGIGKTTTSIYVATALARAGVPTVLVDLDLGAPDVASFFEIKDTPGIERLASQTKINPAQIDRLLVKVDNLYVLPGVMNKTLPRFNAGELVAILNYLKQKYAVVVVDTSPEPWTKKWLYEVFEVADLALAVVDQSKFSEEETKKYGPTLLAMGITPEKIWIVVNRFSPKLHQVRVVEAAFNSGFKKSCKVLPRVGAVINENREKIEKGTYKGIVIGLEDPNSSWHELAQGIAEIAGYRYERTGGDKTTKNTGHGLFGLFGGKR